LTQANEKKEEKESLLKKFFENLRNFQKENWNMLPERLENKDLVFFLLLVSKKLMPKKEHQ
jgi:hypothetical protein